jgi:hypothetical protein
VYKYDISPLIDQNWKIEKEEDRKILLKLLLSQAKNTTYYIYYSINKSNLSYAPCIFHNNILPLRNRY